MQKERAVKDLKYVFHPEQDEAYEHFKDARDHPFVARPEAIGRLNAWWLADAALLSYWTPDIAIGRFERAGLRAEFIQERGAECYLASTDELVLVAFRGTQSDQWSDILDDALFLPVRWGDTNTFVHDGFKRALERLWPLLGPKLENLAKSRSVWFTGHSLGAALATLAAAKFEPTVGLCTVGSPRVGDADFVAALEARMGPRIARYVADADIVTHVPPPLPYRHVGDLRHIGHEGSIAREAPSLNDFFRELIGRVAHLREVVIALCNGHMLHAPDFLLDHMPRGYAVDMWNDYDKNGDRW
jgi:hypothetical protein